MCEVLALLNPFLVLRLLLDEDAVYSHDGENVLGSKVSKKLVNASHCRVKGLSVYVLHTPKHLLFHVIDHTHRVNEIHNPE